MIVVAIIGVLVAVAVPNFQKFLARSKQTEAKTNLGSLYAAQKAFHGEWNMYFADFRDIGFNPEGNLRYHILSAAGGSLPTSYPRAAITGVNGGAGQSGAATYFSTLIYCGINFTAGTTSGQCAEDASFAKVPKLVTPSITVTTFTAGADSDFDRDGTTIDSWSINQDKDLENTQQDF